MSSPGQRLAMIKSMLLWCWWPFEACRMAIRGQTIHGFQGLKCGGVSLVMLWGNKGCMMDVKCKSCLKVVAPTTTKSKDRKSQTDLEKLGLLWNFNRTQRRICQVSILQIEDPLPRSDEVSLWQGFDVFIKTQFSLFASGNPLWVYPPCETNSNSVSANTPDGTLKQIQHLITCSSLGAKTVYKYIQIHQYTDLTSLFKLWWYNIYIYIFQI